MDSPKHIGIKIFDPAFREFQIERGRKKTKRGEGGEGIRHVGGEEEVRKEEAIGEVNEQMKEALILNE